MDVSTVARPVKVSISSKQILFFLELLIIELFNIDCFFLKDQSIIFRKIHTFIVDWSGSFCRLRSLLRGVSFINTRINDLNLFITIINADATWSLFVMCNGV